MSTAAFETKPVQFRLPAWAREFVSEQSREAGTTKTEVIVEAIECLREKKLAALMADGYRELSELNSLMAEESVALASETLPEWDG
ncbi:MAG: hypothetical protein ACYC6C_09050 [Coriobacteriia bacterium]